MNAMSSINVRTETTRLIRPGNRWRWPLVVVGGIVLAAVVQAATVWSMLRWTDVRTESLLAASESRHHRIVSELKRAIVDVVQSDSKELSRVRIRLRTDEGLLLPPFGSWRISLARVGENGAALQPVEGSPMNGDIDFGYRAVGRYMLRVQDDRRWCLEQTIDVWPGVAFDRVIQVPPQLPKEYQGRVDWTHTEPLPPTGAFDGSRPVYAVCELRPQGVTLGGWSWRSTVDHPVFALLGGDPDADRDLLLEEYVSKFAGDFSADELPTLLPEGTKAFEVRSGGYRLVSATLCDLGDSLEPQRGLVPRVVWTSPDNTAPHPAGTGVTVVPGEAAIEWFLTGRYGIEPMPLTLPPELIKAAGDRRVGQGADMAGDHTRNRERNGSVKRLTGMMP